MKKFDWKATCPYLVAIVLFIAFALFYCSPIMDGKVLNAGDVRTWEGAAQEARTYRAQTGQTTYWTNSMFAGMPTYHISGSTPANVFRGQLANIAHLGFGGDQPVGIIIGYLLGFFFMLICFDVKPWLSIVGAIALTCSSYFFLIIPAGHMTKAAALGFLPAMVGGFYAIFRKKYWLGIPLFTLYGIIGITLHPQMSYYVCMMLGIMMIAELYIHIREKRWKDLLVAIGILIISGLLIFGTKLSWYQMNNEYMPETMRGGHSELNQSGKQESEKVGLDIDYVTAWSYGKAETFTLLIPNFMGGASGYNVGEQSSLCENMVHAGVPKAQAKRFCQSVPTYWGDKAFTSGPVYIGAIICFLFVLGLIIVPGPYKWALLISTIFSILLAWGRNWMPFTMLFYDYFPMYNKFRAVESILIVAEIAMPLLGFLALKRVTEQEDKKAFVRPMTIALGVTAGLCLIFALFGGAIDMTSSYDAQWKGQVGEKMYDLILDQRAAMLKADAWRSFVFIALAFGALLMYVKGKLKTGYLYALLGALILVDMVPVDKRFFNSNDFVSKRDGDRFFDMQPWEEQIASDTTLNYRVLNVAANTFNDSRTSYRHSSIGGYSAVKLRRYQDLIDAHISRNNWEVLNMLNTKYIVSRDGSVHLNPEAFGNCWLVDSLLCVGNPDDESEALNVLNLRQVAVTDTTFEPNKGLLTTPLVQHAMEAFGEARITPLSNDLGMLSNDSLTLSSYSPNKLIYQSNTAAERLAVFSEIYYPHGWHLYIDGDEVPLYRVNYTLRAAVIPQGKHELAMEFVPDALRLDKWCMALIILALVFGAVSLGLHFCGKEPKCCPSDTDR